MSHAQFKSPAIRAMEQRVREMDERYRTRIANQVASINRLMAGGTYDTEMEALHTQLAEVMAENDRLRTTANGTRKGASGGVETPATHHGYPGGIPSTGTPGA